ncbi:helix-turn-helix transcriptional regulator [Alphaproteobacteria bacterium]|nr:helix-turn-helix transcriptional regulator [Alphaproteobacteria bacterium]
MDVEYEMLGKDKVVIDRRDFKNMLDIIAFDKVKEKEESFPAELAQELIHGGSPLKTFRKHRNLSQKMLAQSSGVGQGLISEIENGKKKGSISSLKAIADALGIEVDDLL